MHGYKTYLIENADTIYSDGNPQISFSRADGKLMVEFSEMNKDNAYLDVPLLMYTGYSAQLENGTKLDCKYGNHNRIRVNVGNLREGTIIFEYTGTATQKISSIITIFSIMVMLAYLISTQRSQKSIKTLS